MIEREGFIFLHSVVLSAKVRKERAEPAGGELWLSLCWCGHRFMSVAIGTRFQLPAQTTSCMINVNCPFCMGDFFPPAELALVAFDVAGDPMSCNG